jgi:hypothetical protein
MINPEHTNANANLNTASKIISPIDSMALDHGGPRFGQVEGQHLRDRGFLNPSSGRHLLLLFQILVATTEFQTITSF